MLLFTHTGQRGPFLKKCAEAVLVSIGNSESVEDILTLQTPGEMIGRLIAIARICFFVYMQKKTCYLLSYSCISHC